MARLAIMSAMHEELAALLERLRDNHDRPLEHRPGSLRAAREAPAQRMPMVQVAGRQFWQTQWQGHEVVLVLSRIGKVAAATTASVLIERFGVDRIIFSGVAGGLADGDLVGIPLQGADLNGVTDRMGGTHGAAHASHSCPQASRGLPGFQSAAMVMRVPMKATEPGTIQGLCGVRSWFSVAGCRSWPKRGRRASNTLRVPHSCCIWRVNSTKGPWATRVVTLSPRWLSNVCKGCKFSCVHWLLQR